MGYKKIDMGICPEKSKMTGNKGNLTNFDDILFQVF